MRLPSVFVAIGTALCLAGAARAGGNGTLTQARTAATPKLDGAELVQEYCYDCHGDGNSKGKLALDTLLQVPVAKQDDQQWDKIWKTVRQEFMPPAEADALPTPAERRAITDWLAQHRLGVDFHNPDPGRVTIRRLNRMEYEFSVTDLFGVDYDPTDDFVADRQGGVVASRLRDRLPADDSAFGFDNNGDFLSLTPALLDKFFAVAEWVADRTIDVNGPHPAVLNLGHLPLKTVITPEQRAALITGTFNVRHSGSDRLDVEFEAGQFSGFAGSFDLTLTVDHQVVEHRVTSVGGKRTISFSHPITLSAGAHTWSLATRGVKGPALFNDKPNILAPHPRARLVGPMDPNYYENSDSHRRIFFNGAPPASPAAQRTYAREIVRRVADRAWRRPVDDATLDRLADIVTQDPSFVHGVREALVAVLVSPRFLYRAEPQDTPDDPRAIRPLDDYELATRLASVLWLSIPDAELERQAAQGTLRQNLTAETQRMLADPKSERFFEDFPGQWLRTRNVLATPTEQRQQIDGLRSDMKKETEMLFEYIARNDRDLTELVTARYTFLDRKLARFYGLPPVKSDGFQRVDLPPSSHRGGVLTQASFLLSTSNPNRTSAVKRGLYVLDCLWDVQPPAPPPNLPALEDAKIGGKAPKTLHEQLALHRSDHACAACHNYFDPIGVSLENYDLVGRWRTMEGGQPIVVSEETISGETLHGIDDLRKMLAERPERIYRAVAEKLMIYSLGRALEPSDSVAIDEITDRTAADQGKFSTLLLGLFNSPEFLERRGDDGRAPVLTPTDLPKMPTEQQLQKLRNRKKRPVINPNPGTP